MGRGEGPMPVRCEPSLLSPARAGKGGRTMHAPGYLRDAFADWVEEGMPSEVEAEGPGHFFYDGEPHSARWLLGQLSHCSDIMPWLLCDDLGLPQGSTYAEAVRTVMAFEA